MREQLRKAGQALRSVDDDYTRRINAMYKDAHPAVQIAGAMVGGGHPSLRKGDGSDIPNATVRAIYEYGMPAVAAVPKYVLPTAGVGLALKGAIDMANVIGQQTSTTLEPN